MNVYAQHVVSGLLVDPAAYWRIADTITADDMPPEYRALFARIAEQARAEQPYDALVAYSEGFTDAIELARVSIGTAMIEAYAAELRKSSETRLVREAGQRITIANSYDEAQEILASVRPEQTEQIKTVTDGLAEMVDTLQARFNAKGGVTGVPTGIESLDEITSGFQPGNLITLVGETSMGKSTEAMIHALAAAEYAREHDQAVAYFSLEMTAGELTERAVSHLADFPLAWMTHPATAPDYAMDRVQVGSRLLRQLPLLIDDRCGLSLEQITSRALQLHMRRRLSLVVVDYMHIMGRPRRNDVAELGGIAAGLKDLSKRLSAPVIGLHQLNRGNAGNRPTLGDIRASGEIAEASNLVLAIYRSEIARPDYEPLHGYAETLVLKNRQGRRDVRAWMKSRIGNMRLDSCEAPEGYDETIKPDLDRRSTGSAGSAGSNGGIASRGRASRQPSPLSLVGRGD